MFNSSSIWSLSNGNSLNTYQVWHFAQVEVITTWTLILDKKDWISCIDFSLLSCILDTKFQAATLERIKCSGSMFHNHNGRSKTHSQYKDSSHNWRNKVVFNGLLGIILNYMYQLLSASIYLECTPRFTLLFLNLEWSKFSVVIQITLGRLEVKSGGIIQMQNTTSIKDWLRSNWNIWQTVGNCKQLIWCHFLISC